MDFKKALPYIVALVVLLVIAIGFFPPAMQGKVVFQPDKITAEGKQNEIDAYHEETGEWSLWTNQLFGGMPTFYGGAQYPSIWLKPIAFNGLMLGLPKPISLFFLSFLCAFILFMTMRAGPWLSVLGALAFGLCTYNFVIYQAGHDNKLFAIAFFPAVVAGMLMVLEQKKYLAGGTLFAVALGFEIMTSHVQMTYYLAIACLIYVILKLIEEARKGEIQGFVKGGAFLLIAAFLAVGANSSRLLSTYQYMKETMRGPKVLQNDKNEVDSKDGLAKDYVFNWSHGISEALTFLVPGAFGGASQEKVDKDSEYYKSMRRLGVSGPALERAPLYWGDMPGTSGPVYFGAIVMMLFILGIVLIPGTMKWWLTGTTVLMMLLSFGKNLEWFNDLFYYHFPMYDKFRAVSSILVILQLTLPLMAVMTLKRIIDRKDSLDTLKRGLMIAAGTTGGLALILIVAGGALFDFAGASDARLAQAGYDVGAIVSDRQSLMRTDAFRSLIFILLGAGLIWMYATKKMKALTQPNTIIGILAFLILIDLGGIGRRYLSSDNFISKRQYEANWTPRDVDRTILQDSDPNFRVHDLSINSFNSNTTTYHHKTIGGYHAAKLRRYQDMIEAHIGPGNMAVLSMLNTKYIIDQKGELRRNSQALGHAWFVKGVEIVNTPDEEIAALGGFNVRDSAVVHQEFASELPAGMNGQGSIQLQDYKPNHLTYQTNSGSEQLAVMSEVWYDPGQGKGWQAYIDGNPVDHIRVNYLLRGLVVPAGNHTIEFKFFPGYYYMGETISLIFNILLLLLIGYYGFTQWRTRRS